MLGLIKYALAIVLFIWFLSTDFFINIITRLKDFIIGINENVFVHFTDEVYFLYMFFIFALIFIFIKRFYDKSRD